jgi:hypothetical protein
MLFATMALTTQHVRTSVVRGNTMRLPRVQFTMRAIVLAVASIGIALKVSSWSRHELLYAYGLGMIGFIGLSPIVISYLWLREPACQGQSASVEILISRFAIVCAVGVVFWAMLALWADPFY